MSTYGTLSAGNLILSNPNGSFNFLQSLNSVASISVLCSLFDKSLEISDCASDFHTKVTGGAQHVKEVDHVALNVFGTGDRVVLQSKEYIPSQIGSTRIVTITANMEPVSGVVSRVGCFDDAVDNLENRGDGYYFEMNEGALYACFRTSTSPSGEVKIQQSLFNIDRLDGSGASLYTFDSSTATTFVISYESRTGSVKVGIIARGSIIFVHRFDPSSSYGPIRATSLPVRFEIESAGSEGTLMALNGAVSTSGSIPRGIKRSCGTGARATDVSVNAASHPIVSLKLQSQYRRASARITGVRISSTASVFWELLLNASPAGAAWKPTSSSGVTEYDVSSAALDAGDSIVIASGYVRADDAALVEINDAPPLTSSILGDSEIYTLNAVALMSSCLVWGGLELVEIV
ncbi:hypothetical protein JKP88DRAFT_241060 [Tribonema minus]|uniref:Uncharacterized protein n=1 Tax=Tribonema minus TaxID=303371 RepID=A0A835Z437_9STRA|nr:hypothetical protein JKP88DRAFT_241060 [Tribonema minus]